MDKKTVSEQLKDAQADVARLTQELSEAHDREAAQSQNISSATDEISALRQKVEQQAAVIQSRDTEIAALTMALEEARQSAAAVAEQRLASIGVPPVAADVAPTASASKEQLVKEWQAIEDPKAREAFYNTQIAPLLRR